MASLPKMKERVITLNGFSKSYAMTGWRIGYLAAPQSFVRMLTEPRHTLSINTNTPAQFAALAALTGPQEVVAEMLAAYTERRSFMMKAMDDMGLGYGHPGGAFYLYTNISKTGMPAAQFCETLLREGQVLLFPGSMFGDESENYVRMSYLQPLNRIEEAMKRMAKVIASHRIST
jgi:aminotransferase